MHLIAAAVAALVSYFGVRCLHPWAERKMLDFPNVRSSHSRPTARGGGLVIVACTVTGLLLFHAFSDELSARIVLAYSLGAGAVAFGSWQDDRRSLARLVRFTAHVGAALVILVAAGFWQQVPLPLAGDLDLGWLGAPLAFCWIVGFTNGYNFMDGIDGLAGSQAVVAGLGWLGLGLISEQTMLSALGTLLAGSSLGFLGWNWPPARIFMGDVGSAFLGYTFAVAAVIASQSNPRRAVAGILMVWPFVFDTALTLFCRLRRRENVFEAHRTHLYQRLVAVGLSHRSVTSVYVVFSIVGAVLGWMWTMAIGSGWLAIVVPVLLFSALWWYVRRCESYPGPGRPFAHR